MRDAVRLLDLVHQGIRVKCSPGKPEVPLFHNFLTGVYNSEGDNPRRVTVYLNRRIGDGVLE